MPASDTEVEIAVYDRQPFYSPGDQIKGRVSVMTTGKTLLFSALRLVWTGRIMTQLAGQYDRKEYFNQVLHLDPSSDAFTFATDLQTPGAMVQVTERASFPFQVALPTDLVLPSSFSIDDPSTGAIANVEYVLEVSLDHQTFDPMPIKARTIVPVLAPSFPPMQDAQQQQISERTYLATVLKDHAEYRTAVRVTVPCKLACRGAMVPVVAHIWHDCKYSRRNGVSMTLVRMCRINCGEHTEVLTKELKVVTRDLDLDMRQGYSMQTLIESLQVPVDITPTIPIECGELVSVEYKVFVAVHAHPDALYTELPSTHATEATQYMLVDMPIYVDVQQEQPKSYYESNKAEEQLAPLPKDSGKKKSRMKGMFRRQSKMDAVPSSDSSASISTKTKSSSMGQVMSAFRFRGKSSSPTPSVSSVQNPSTNAPTSPALSITSSVTDASKPPRQSTSSQTSVTSSPPFLPPPPVYMERAPVKPASASSTWPLPPPPPPAARPASIHENDEGANSILPPPPPPAARPASIHENDMRAINSLPPPPPPPAARPASIHRKDMPTINSILPPPPPIAKEGGPIPGLDGGGVYTFHMFHDSDDEDAGPVNINNSVDNSVDAATTVTNDSNVQYFDMFPDSDSDDEEPAVQKQAVHTNMVYPDPVNKLDQVSESESDEDDSDEDSDDLLSVVKRREDRIERAKSGPRK